MKLGSGKVSWGVFELSTIVFVHGDDDDDDDDDDNDDDELFL